MYGRLWSMLNHVGRAQEGQQGPGELGAQIFRRVRLTVQVYEGQKGRKYPQAQPHGAQNPSGGTWAH